MVPMEATIFYKLNGYLNLNKLCCHDTVRQLRFGYV